MTRTEPTIRLLGLGNDILGDDAFGILVAERIRRLSWAGVEVAQTSATGFNLMDDIQNATHLLVIDTVLTGATAPGTVRVLREEDVEATPGSSQHYIGLFEALALGRRLQLPVPENVVILAVEAADCFTVGGAMHPAVQAAIPGMIALSQKIVRQWQGDGKSVGR